MGVVIRNIDTIGQTGQLVDWITKVRCKKINAKKLKKKNLFVEAVLAHALNRAETELRTKQQERLRRWQQIKTSWSSNNNICSKQMSHTWNPSSCEDLTSLDSFMTQLKTVKCQIER